MKKRNLVVLLCCLFAVGMIALNGCKKKDATSLDNDTAGASDNATAENVSNDVIAVGSQASDGGTLSSYRMGDADFILSTCATVYHDTINKIDSVVFNGGSCLDGRTRSGSLVFDHSASPAGAKHYRDPGFTFSVRSHNYVVDGNQVTIISKTVTNTTPVGFNPSTTNEKWAIAANLSIVKANGNTITWTSTRTKTLLNTATVYTNAQTPIDWPHAKIQIDGAASGTRANGETFTATATAMVRDFGGCSIGGKHPWISGTLNYAPSGKYARLIDFGTGTCDLNATVTINGNTYNIILP
ncbi:MAG: hypothetical protein WCL14_10265 [Bacteroidota bacterium]